MSLASPKTVNLWGFGAKVESTYGTKNQPVAADGILLTKIPGVDVAKFLDAGDRGMNPLGGQRTRSASSGRFGEFKLEAEGIGAGAAYAAGVKPHLDVMILGAGHKGTGSFTASQESWVYSPSMYPTDTLTSLTLAAFLAGQLYTIYGGLGDLEINSSGPQVPDWMFDFSGVQDPMTDTTILGFTYPAVSNTPQKADVVSMTIGLYTAAVVRGFNFKAGRNFKNPRTNMSSGLVPGMSGFVAGGRQPKMEVVIERDTLHTSSPWTTASTINPYQLAEEHNQIVFKMQVGTVQYKRWGIFSGTTMSAGIPAPAQTAIVEEVKETQDGPIATWTLTIGFYPSTYVASDDYGIYYN